MNHLQQIKAYGMFDTKLLLREPMVLFFAFALPAIMYAALGSIFGGEVYGVDAKTYYDEYTASFFGIILLTVGLFNVGPPVIVYKEMGFFKSLYFTPLSPFAILVATIARCGAIAVVGLLEVVVVGWLMFDRVPSEFVLQVSLVMIVSAYTLFAFGFMLACFTKTSAAAYGLSIVAFQVMLLLSGASIPIDQFPGIVKIVTMVVPMTYVVDALRLAWHGSIYTLDGLVAMSVIVGCGVVFTAISARKFEWY